MKKAMCARWDEFDASEQKGNPSCDELLDAFEKMIS